MTEKCHSAPCHPWGGGAVFKVLEKLVFSTGHTFGAGLAQCSCGLRVASYVVGHERGVCVFL